MINVYASAEIKLYNEKMSAILNFAERGGCSLKKQIE
jgi:hypothetical protein